MYARVGLGGRRSVRNRQVMEQMSKQLTDDILLYRIMPLEQLLHMLVSKENTLVSPSSWEDPYEKMMKKSILTLSCGEQPIIDIDSIFNWMGWYGQCWTRQMESDGLWRSYTHNKNDVRCVKIQTTVKKLKESLHSGINDKKVMRFYLEPVEYFDFSQDDNKKQFGQLVERLQNGEITIDRLQETLACATLLMKRKAFEYEDEVRILAYDILSNPIQRPFCYSIEESLRNSLIENIELDPWTPNYYMPSFKKLFSDLANINEEQVTRSELYDEPDTGYTITYNMKDDDLIKRVFADKNGIIIQGEDGKRCKLKTYSGFTPVASDEQQEVLIKSKEKESKNSNHL